MRDELTLDPPPLLYPSQHAVVLSLFIVDHLPHQELRLRGPGGEEGEVLLFDCRVDGESLGELFLLAEEVGVALAHY